jgi:hypothetical protein
MTQETQQEGQDINTTTPRLEAKVPPERVNHIKPRPQADLVPQRARPHSLVLNKQ